MSNPHGSLEDKIPAIDHVVKVCSALVNLCPAIVLVYFSYALVSGIPLR